jgi:hypothetical protein
MAKSPQRSLRYGAGTAQIWQQESPLKMCVTMKHTVNAWRALGSVQSCPVTAARARLPHHGARSLYCPAQMKAGKAPGVDGVLSIILREAAGAVGCSDLKTGNWTVRVLTVMFNLCVQRQRGIISPFHKQDSRLEPGNYLLSEAGKVSGSVIASLSTQCHTPSGRRQR